MGNAFRYLLVFHLTTASMTAPGLLAFLTGCEGAQELTTVRSGRRFLPHPRSRLRKRLLWATMKSMRSGLESRPTWVFNRKDTVFSTHISRGCAPEEPGHCAVEYLTVNQRAPPRLGAREYVQPGGLLVTARR